jgi:acetyl esterase
MPLDPNVQSLLEAIAAAGLPKIGSVPAATMREVMSGFTAHAPRGPELYDVEDSEVPTEYGAIPVRIYKPTADPQALIVYYHGGGWTIGTLDDYDATLRKLALRTGSAIVSVDYRLAPEHPFPAAVEDAIAALNWAAGNVEAITGKKAPVIVAGDSAGGNLSAVVSQIARDSAGPAIAAQILIYPSTDGDIDSDSMTKFEPPFLTREEIAWFCDRYIPEKSRRRDPRFAPSHATDLSGLPPALVLTAEYDLLCEEGERYASLLSRAGVSVRVERYSGTFHGFFSMDGGLPHSVKATDDIADFVLSIAGLRSTAAASQ